MSEQTLRSDAVKAAASLKVRPAASPDEVRAAQRLRYRIFAGDMGARLHTAVPEHDVDRFDEHCQHLLVWDEVGGQLAGSTRILLPEGARSAGGYYSQTEFDLTAVLDRPGRFMELGRTCIHPEYRNGLTIATLWMGVAEMLKSERCDYLIGCCSIGLDQGFDAVRTLIGHLRVDQVLDTAWSVRARHRLPDAAVVDARPVSMPPLLKAYLRLGAQVAAEPCWDEDFNVADVFILLDQQRVAQRYARHFRVAA